MLVQDAQDGSPTVALNARTPMNPASVAKLLTTYAALDQLGPAWTWATPVWLQGSVQGGVLEGSVFIKGSGDPKLVLERVWLMLRRIQQLGVRDIRGDIVLDNSAFALAEGSPFEFDGESMRPYNVRPSALLFNYKAVIYGFAPDPARGVARVTSEPPLAGLEVDRSVPLSAGPCGDWADALKATFSITRTRFSGTYPAACGPEDIAPSLAALLRLDYPMQDAERVLTEMMRVE